MDAVGRMDSGFEQRLIGIDVPHSRHQVLPQKCGFDGCFPPPQARTEGFPGELIGERLQAQACEVLLQPGIDRLYQVVTAELARVAVEQTPAVLQVNFDVCVAVGSVLPRALQTGHRLAQELRRVRLLGIPDRHLSGHAEMDDPVAVVQFNCQELAAPTKAAKRPALKATLQSARPAVKHPTGPHPHSRDPGADKPGLQSQPNGLNFRQLGHSVMILDWTRGG